MTSGGHDTQRQRLVDENRRLREQLAAKDCETEQLKQQLAKVRKILEQLSDEVRRLKNLPKRPKLKPSGMHKKNKKSRRGRRKPQQYSEKAATKEVLLTMPDVPPDSRFIGYRPYTVQDFIMLPVKIRYQREKWLTPCGKYLIAPLPEQVRGHYGGNVQRLVVSLYHQAQTTLPRITELLNDWGVCISKRTVMRMLSNELDALVNEAQQVLSAAMAGANWLHVDDTGARHCHKNSYCTVIGNDRFTSFTTSDTKSRVNFLECLSAGKPNYVFNEQAFDYMRTRKLPQCTVALLKNSSRRRFDTAEDLTAHLVALGVNTELLPDPVKITTEGAIWGHLSESGLLEQTVILSDDAGQFKLGEHALCWVHAERRLQSLLASSEPQRAAVEAKQHEIWDFYYRFRDYCEKPDAEQRHWLTQRFDEIFTSKTDYHALNQQLQRLYNRKSGLLKALDYPLTPLHNNLAENDLRAQVTRRKISAGTRSDSGLKARDACLGLLKTCRKQNISFWDYLGHRFRVPDAPHVPNLTTLVAQRE